MKLPLPVGHTVGCGEFNGQKLYDKEHMHEYAIAAIHQYREFLKTELAKRHEMYKHAHNYYLCLVREIDDGVL